MAQEEEKKKSAWQKVSDWWNKPTSAERASIDINEKKAQRGPISTYDVTPTVYGRESVVKENMSEDAKKHFNEQNGPFLDPKKGPMPPRYHRNRHDDIVGAEIGSKSDSPLLRWATESIARDDAEKDKRQKKLMNFLKGKK